MVSAMWSLAALGTGSCLTATVFPSWEIELGGQDSTTHSVMRGDGESCDRDNSDHHIGGTGPGEGISLEETNKVEFT